MELWDALNRDGQNLSVDGPPGTGKSTEVWAWALWKASTDFVTVTWFHLTKNEVVKVVINGTDKSITTGYVAKITDIQDSVGSILIVDGVHADISTKVRQACCNWRKSVLTERRRFVLVSSVSVNVALQENKESNIVNFTVGSWTFEQYEDACANEQFFWRVRGSLSCPGLDEDSEKDQLLLSKYYFAGGCARWMFEFTYEEWVDDFNTHLQKVTNYALLFEGGSGDQDAVAVNHLRGLNMVSTDGTYVKKYFFISQHAAKVLANKCNDKRKFLVDSYKMADATKNPAFKGWIFEFDIDYQLTKACGENTKFCSKIRSLTADGTSSTTLTEDNRPVNSYIEFTTKDDELSNAIRSLGDEQVLWAKPKLWCQKAYDFVCFWKDGSNLNMVVVNVTLAATHSVLLTEVKKLAASLGEKHCEITGIRFDFIVPKGAVFAFGTITGRLCGWKNLHGVKWPNSASVNSYLDHLVVAEIVTTS